MKRGTLPKFLKSGGHVPPVPQVPPSLHEKNCVSAVSRISKNLSKPVRQLKAFAKFSKNLELLKKSESVNIRQK